MESSSPGTLDFPQEPAGELATLRAAVDQCSDAIIITDPQGLIVYANPACESLYGCGRGELVGTHVDALNRDTGTSTTRIIPAIQAKGHWQGELEQRRKDGSTFWVQLSASLVALDGTPYGMLGILRDVTAGRAAEASRRSHEAELLQRNQFIETILDNLPIGLAVNHIDGGQAVYMNRKFEEIYGWPKEQLEDIGEFFLRVYPDPAYRQQIKERVFADILSNDPERMSWEDVEVTGADGSKRIVAAKNIPIYDQNLMVSTVQDTTRRVELQEQLQQSQKMEAVGRLAGGVAHDFNNMLGVILGHAELALARGDAGERATADLRAIQDAAERSANLTRQLLAFARKQAIAPQLLDLNVTVEGMLRMLRRVIGEDITLEWRPGPALRPIRMDPSQLDQMLVNLCVNARDAIQGVGHVRIGTRNASPDQLRGSYGRELPPGQYVCLTVEDSGCGMDGETLRRAFEPFFSTKEVGQGTGLGLSTVYGIVKQNGGSVFAHSQPQDGATFVIFLPAHDAEAARAAAAECAEARPAHETVLLVEDEEGILEVAQQMLSRLGYRVLAASSPHAALRTAREHAGGIDLLVTDVIMPEMNGRDLSDALAALYPAMKCMFISGYPADVVSQHGVLEAGVQFLQKPFSSRELAAKVRAALDGA